MNINIAQLVKDSMERLGCGERVAGDLDAHSPICIGFHAVPDIHIEQQGERVRLWSRLPEVGEQGMAQAAPDLLAYFLPRGGASFVCRRPLLSMVEGELILHAVLEEQALGDVEPFTLAIEMFFEDVSAVSEILAR